MSSTAKKHEIDGCPVPPDAYKFIEDIASANGMNVSTFTAWAMTRWATVAMDRCAARESPNKEVSGAGKAFAGLPG